MAPTTFTSAIKEYLTREGLVVAIGEKEEGYIQAVADHFKGQDKEVRGDRGVVS